MLTLLAISGVWGLLLCGCVWAWEQAEKTRRREWWRSIMAGLVGLGALWRKDGR